MSSFLGPIHNWLFNKIKFQDELVQYIVGFIYKKDSQIPLLAQMDQRYGVLETGELADIIDESNIHGWLQERITIVENRLAFLITMTTDEHPEIIMDINDAVYEFGKNHAVENGISVKEAYGYLDNLLLNGMPCDSVNEITNEDENSIAWVQTVDIHASYWQMIHGNVEYYYAIRENLVIGMLENSGISYQHSGEQSFELRKEA